MYNSVGVKKNRLYNLKILQNDIWGKIQLKKKKRKKQVILENNQGAHKSSQKDRII